MWALTVNTLNTDMKVYVSDGLPVNSWRSAPGTSFRVTITPLGFVDVTDLGETGGVPRLSVNGVEYSYTGQGYPTIGVQVKPPYSFTLTGNGNEHYGVFMKLLPTLQADDLAAVAKFEANGFIPYSQLLNGQRPFSSVEPLAPRFFPFTESSRALALSIYDWTTADFFRMDVLNLYRYTELGGEPLDVEDIVDAISTANWPPYSDEDEPFMHSMMLTPSNNRDDIERQFLGVQALLRGYLDALKSITVAAITAFPRVDVQTTPKLYSGQVAIQNLGMNAMAVYFREYPGNAGPVGARMGMPVVEALNGFMAVGQTLHLKTFLSFTNTYEDALHYQNGIILELDPLPGSAVWTQTACVTPFSDEAGKTEYPFPPGSGFRVTAWRQEKGPAGQPIVVISLVEQAVGGVGAECHSV